MKWWEALILGLVQGASEFLPISSSGHLLLLEKLGLGSQSLLFNVCVHLGTLVAVLIVLRKSWMPLIRHPFQKTTGYIMLACLPTVGIALIFKFLLPPLLDGAMLGFGFVLTACLIFAGEKLKIAKTTSLSVKTSLLTGVLQGIAVLPGVSRSGATISAMTTMGVPKGEAANFSFLLSVPIILGSAILEGAQVATSGMPSQADVGALIIGSVAAFISGLFAIKLFLKLIAKHSMLPFALYTFILGITVTLLPLVGIRL